MGRLPARMIEFSATGVSVGVVAAVFCWPSPGTAVSRETPSPVDPVMVEVKMPVKARQSGTVHASLLPSSRASRSRTTAENWQLPPDAYSMDGSILRLGLDPAEIPKQFVDSGGLVTVQVGYASSQTGRAGSVLATVRAVSADGERGWVDPADHLPSLEKSPKAFLPQVSVAEVAQARGRTAARNSARSLLTSSAPTLRMRLEKVKGKVVTGGGFRVGTRTMLREPIGGVPKCGYLDKWRKRWATVGTSYPLKSSKSWLTYSATSTSSFGVAVSLYGGAFKASDTRTLSDDWGQEFVPKSFNRSFRVQVRYRLQRCTYSDGREISRKWIPQWETGGTRGYKLGKAPSHFKTCAPIAPGPWYRGGSRGRDYTLSTGVKFKSIIGVDLSTRRAYTNGAKLFYVNDKRRRVCGNNDDPSRASKVRERRW